MTDFLWLLVGFGSGLPLGVFFGYQYAGRRGRALPSYLNSGEESL